MYIDTAKFKKQVVMYCVCSVYVKLWHNVRYSLAHTWVGGASKSGYVQ